MAQDLYRFFRIEAKELVEGLGQSAVALTEGIPARETVARMLRLAHTLKGAARVVRQSGMADTAHTVEDVLTPFRECDTAMPQERCGDVLALVETLNAQLKAIDAPPPAPPPSSSPPTNAEREPGDRPSPPKPPDEPLRLLRIEINDLDDILDGVAQASVSLSALSKGIASIQDSLTLTNDLIATLTMPDGDRDGVASPSTRVRGLAERLNAMLLRFRDELAVATERTSRDLERTGDIARRLRLIPVSTIVPALERTAQDAAEHLGKMVRLDTVGGDVQLDAHVLGGLRDALVQLVRNAVAHGIETGSTRTAAGKPAVGRIELQIERRGHRVVLRCRDGGGGLDLIALREVALRRGLVASTDAFAAMSPDETVALAFRGGLSTARTVTPLSGRGVGLDLVRDVMQRLKGELSVRTEVGHGTTVEISVPVSLTSMTVLQVEVGGLTVSLPLGSIVRTMKVTADMATQTWLGDALVFEGQAIPFLHLPTLFMADAAPGASLPTMVLIEASGTRAVVGVDRLLGTATIFMRRLPTLCDTVPWIAGASFDEDGNPLLVLDPVGMVAAAVGGHAAMPPITPLEQIHLLVVDDSLTTRMLEQSILEAAGFHVELAASGEEGLDKARNQPPALFIVDVEMPGINGYEFIRHAREDPVLKSIPAIMVSSLASDVDRQRAVEAGAQDYIVKSEFDEGRLLQRIRALIHETDKRP